MLLRMVWQFCLDWKKAWRMQMVEVTLMDEMMG